MVLFGSVLLFILVGSSVSGSSDLEIITAKNGDDVTLRCGDKDIDEIYLLQWTKPNLEREEMVFLYRNDGILLYQHESFKNRVSLNNSQMKDGDLSVVLENVKIEDSGTYECRILRENGSQRGWKLISSINLLVSPPSGEEGGWKDGGGVKDGEKKDGVKEEEKGTSQGVLVAIVLQGILLYAGLVLVLIYVNYQIFKMTNGSNQSSGGSKNQQNPESDHLNTYSILVRISTDTDSSV